MSSDNDFSPSLAHALHRTFIQFAHKPFLGYTEYNVGNLSEHDITYKWLSYQHIFHKVLRLADSFRRLSIAKRSVIGICADNSVEWLVTDFSCCFNDYITVGIHSSWNEDSLEHVLESAKVTTIVCKESELSKFIKASVRCCIENIIVINDTDKIGNTSQRQNSSKSSVNIFSFEELFTDNIDSYNRCKDNNSNSSSNGRGDIFKSITGAGAAIPSWFGLHPAVSISESDEIHTLLYTSGTMHVCNYFHRNLMRSTTSCTL